MRLSKCATGVISMTPSVLNGFLVLSYFKIISMINLNCTDATSECFEPH